MQNMVVALALCCISNAAQAANSPQAAEAVRKHRAEQTNSSSVSTTSTASGPKLQSLEACKNAAGLNVYQRERCVWRICKGRWGQGGCPPGTDQKFFN
jgi:hypothetical protein